MSDLFSLNSANYPKPLGSTGEFQGYASVFNLPDHEGDIIEPGAFTETLKHIQKTKKFPKLLWQHDTSQPIGVILELEEDSYGLKMHGKLLLELPKAREAYTLLSHGGLEGLSIGFQIKKAFKRNYGISGRRIQKVDLFEISLVTFSAHPGAYVTQVKGTPFSYLTQKFLKDVSSLTSSLSTYS